MKHRDKNIALLKDWLAASQSLLSECKCELGRVKDSMWIHNITTMKEEIISGVEKRLYENLDVVMEKKAAWEFDSKQLELERKGVEEYIEKYVASLREKQLEEKAKVQTYTTLPKKQEKNIFQKLGKLFSKLRIEKGATVT